MSVSDCEFALVKPSARGFVRMLLTGGLFAAAAITMQNFKPPSHQNSIARRPALFSFIDARPSAPSIYDEERRMSSAQLLNRWDAFVTEASQRFGIPKNWIRAVMRQESGGRTMLGQDRPIVSSAGAIGLMQVMPATYAQMAQAHRLGGDPMNARDNIMAGAAYLRWLHQRYGYPKMFAAYNAGPGRVEQGGRLPAETRAYILGIASTLRAAKGGEGLVNLTRPDGQTVKLDPARVAAIRAPLPGEYAPSVKAVLTVGGHHQAVREDVRVATAAIRATGGAI